MNLKDPEGKTKAQLFEYAVVKRGVAADESDFELLAHGFVIAKDAAKARDKAVILCCKNESEVEAAEVGVRPFLGA